MDADDNSLLVRFRAGEQACLNLYYDLVSAKVLRAINSTLKDEQKSLEIVAEAFERFARRIASRTFDLEKPAFPYLLTTARRVLISRQRSAGREAKNIQDLWTALAGKLRPASSSGLSVSFDELDEAVKSLNKKEQELLTLRYGDGMAFAAIGSLRGAPENTIRDRHDRVLDKLRAKLGIHQLGSNT